MIKAITYTANTVTLLIENDGASSTGGAWTVNFGFVIYKR